MKFCDCNLGCKCLKPCCNTPEKSYFISDAVNTKPYFVITELTSGEVTVKLAYPVKIDAV